MGLCIRLIRNMGEIKAMTLAELKKAIIDRQVSDDLIVFVCPDGNDFIANEYTDALVKLRNGSRRLIQSLDATKTATAFFLSSDKPVYVLRTDILSERHDDFSGYKNTIIICNKVDKAVFPAVKDYVISIPELTDWQVLDFIKSVCPEIGNEAEWLYHACNKDVFKIKNVLDRIRPFPAEQRRELLTELKNLPYSDLFEDDFFSFTDALLSKNTSVVLGFRQHRFCCDLEPVAIVNTLLQNLLKVLDVCFSSSVEACKLITNPKQYYAIKRHYRNIPLGRLMYCIDEMSGIDLKLKTGLLDFNGDKDLFLSFIVVRRLS